MTHNKWNIRVNFSIFFVALLPLYSINTISAAEPAANNSSHHETPPVMDLSKESDPRVRELLANGASMEEIAAIKGPAIQTPEQAIRELKIGNTRFINGQTQRPDIPVNLRRVQILKQTPFAVVLGCADSRVPTELVYDQGLGSIFTARNAGNVAGDEALGSIEYAVKHLKPHVIVVMGHEGCGAVHAAMLPAEELKKEPDHLQFVINQIVPAVADLPLIRDRKAKMREAVISNVRLQEKRLNEDPVIKSAVAAKTIRVIGAYYEITTGAVEFLDIPEELHIK